jgi:hypothetical protein
MKKLHIAVLIVVCCAAPAHAQIGALPRGVIQSRGPVTNPPEGTVLAEVTNIRSGPHVFSAIITVVGAGTSVLLEWRGSRGAKWSQLIVVTRETGTIVVPIQEPQAFEEGDRLRLTVSEAAGITIGTVWASLSLQ